MNNKQKRSVKILLLMAINSAVFVLKKAFDYDVSKQNSEHEYIKIVRENIVEHQNKK